MTVLVTGYRGFVGSHLCRALDPIWIGLDLKDGADINTVSLPDNIDRVYHLAAQVDAYCPDTALDAKTNIVGTIRLLEKYGDKVVYASSSMINYPTTPYAISKLAGEYYARLYGAAVVRFCNLFGGGGHSVIDKFQQQETLTIFGTGEQRRTYAPVSAAVQALLDAKPGSIRVLEGNDYTVMEIAKRTGKPIQFERSRRFDLVDGVQR